MNIRLYAAGVLGALAISAGSAGVASASASGGGPPTYPTPTVSAAPVTVTPTPTATYPARHPRPKAEQFSVQRSVLGAVTVNDVEASGPVALAGGTDTQLTFNRDELSQGGSAVQLIRTGFPSVTVNRGACTVTVTESGRWAMVGAAGADLHATGSGSYALAALFAFSEVPLYRHGPAVCPASALAFYNVLRLLGGVTPYVTPSFSDVAVHGAGTARI